MMTAIRVTNALILADFANTAQKTGTPADTNWSSRVHDPSETKNPWISFNSAMTRHASGHWGKGMQLKLKRLQEGGAYQLEAQLELSADERERLVAQNLYYDDIVREFKQGDVYDLANKNGCLLGTIYGMFPEIRPDALAISVSGLAERGYVLQSHRPASVSQIEGKIKQACRTLQSHLLVGTVFGGDEEVLDFGTGEDGRKPQPPSDDIS